MAALEQSNTMDKEAFVKELHKLVEEAYYTGDIYTCDVTRKQFNKLVEDNKLDAAQAEAWLVETGDFIPTETKSGWQAPWLKQKIHDQAQEKHDY